MITNTLIHGLNQKMVQARLNTADAKPFLFATHFPVKRVNGFMWAMLTNQLSKKNVAADIHTDNGTIARKQRPIMESEKGDIPYIGISREMKRSEIKDYQTALKFATDTDATKLVQYWGEDIDFCFNGVQSELEYIAWKLLSGGGKMVFDTTTNATYANEFNLDYGVGDDLLKKTSTDWGAASSADVIGDLAKLVKAAKDLNLNPKFAFINLDELYKICSAEQIIKACASYMANAVGMAQTPDLAQVNAMLSRQPWLNGLHLRVIDQTITREYGGTKEDFSGNPFDDARLVLAETERLGTTQYDILQDTNPAIIRAERAHTVVKKYSTVEPFAEVTIGEANAIPVLDTAYRNLYVRTNNTNW